MWIVAAMFLGLDAMIAFGTDWLHRASVAEAERFLLRDGRGRVRAELATREVGPPMLALLDEEGRSQVTLRSRSDAEGALEFHDRGQLRLALNAAVGGFASLDLYDRQNRCHAGMYLWPDSTTGLGLRNGAQAVEPAAQSDGLSALSVSDAGGAIRGRVGSLPEDVRVRGPFGSFGRRPFEAPSLARREPVLRTPAPSADDPHGSAGPIRDRVVVPAGPVEP